MRAQSLAQALSKGTPRLAVLRRGTRALSRQERLRLAPRVPDALALRYLRVTNAIQDQVERKVLELLVPVAEAQDPRSQNKNPEGAPGSLPADITPTSQAVPDLILARSDAVSKDFEDAFAALNAELMGMLDEKNLSPILTDLGERTVQHADKEIARSLSIDLRGSEGKLDPYVQDFVRKNVRLIRSVSFDQLDRMREIVSAYHAGQTNQKSLRDQIMDTFGLSRARASLIARDQILKANADIAQLRQTQVGVQEYIWTTSNDERVRGRPGGKWPGPADHWHLDGTVQRWDQPPVTNPRTGERNHPGRDFQCRCVAVPVVDKILYKP